jgi:hypothetical protein
MYNNTLSIQIDRERTEIMEQINLSEESINHLASEIITRALRAIEESAEQENALGIILKYALEEIHLKKVQEQRTHDRDARIDRINRADTQMRPHVEYIKGDKIQPAIEWKKREGV